MWVMAGNGARALALELCTPAWVIVGSGATVLRPCKLGRPTAEKPRGDARFGPDAPWKPDAATAGNGASTPELWAPLKPAACIGCR